MNRHTSFVMATALVLWAAFQGAISLSLSSVEFAEGRWQPEVGAWRVVAQSDDEVSGDAIGLSSAVTAATGVTVAAPISVSVADTATQSTPPNQAVGIVTDTANVDGPKQIAVSDSLTTTKPISDGVGTSDGSSEPPVSDEAEVEDETALLGIVDGTILANRTTSTARFFVEGQMYELPSLRSIGVDLPRTSAVLNLFNCDALVSEDEESCYWDPYMVDRTGFYEIVAGQDVGRAVSLLLQEVGGPDGADIWIQNRSSKSEIVVYRSEVYDLQPGAIREFSVGDDALPTFFLRSCIEVDGASACEWAPVVAEPSVYYVLREVEVAGGLPNSRATMLELISVSGNDQTSQETPLAAKQILCDLLVPALNVRSGPGLEYEIVAKIRGTDAAPASVMIIGRTANTEWLTVDERVARGGWITGSASYVSCESPLSELDVAEVTDGRLAPTPVPEPQSQAVEPQPEAPSEGEPASDEQAVEATPTPIVEIPDGQSLLIINNGFDHDIRFTLDQKYRVQPGPSEYDLQPGDSVSILVLPGMVGFSASTPWRGLSDNDDFFIEKQESRTLWLLFMPDPDGSGRWLLQY